MDSGKRFFDPATGKYSGHKDALFDSISAFFTSCTSLRNPLLAFRQPTDPSLIPQTPTILSTYSSVKM